MNNNRPAHTARFAQLWLPCIAIAGGLLCGLQSATAQTYRSHAQIGTIVQNAETNYPAICKWYSLGDSVQGRELWALRISDNVGVDEDEPEFKYVSTMHGDEIIGVEMCLNLIDYLTTNYGSDAQVDNIVNEVDLWIVPLMNPDGYEAPGRTRGNANGTDLNRDFPDLGEPNTPAGHAVETGLIMNWGAQRYFTASANFHGGALVVNYPFDNMDTGSQYSPDDDLFVWMSEQYSQHNSPMWNGSWLHGITNGADWYVIDGGMQDWNYHFTGCNEVTIELSDNKQPPAAQIPTFWNENRDSMLAYIETCLVGVRGVVTDIDTGLPLAATVTVVGRDHEIYTDPSVGDYHRMLLAGNYDLRFEATGYDPIVKTGIAYLGGTARRIDAALSLPPQLVTPDGGEVYGPGEPVSISWTGSPDAQFHVRYTANADDMTVTGDGFESGSLSGNYTTGGNAPWSATTSDKHSGLWSARAGSISHNQQSWVTRTVNGGDLSFWYRVSSEYNYDWFNFYVDGNRVVHESGTTGGWTQYATTLATGSHELKWEYDKDGSDQDGSDTAWIDDLTVTQDNTTWNDIVPLTAVGATSTSWTPPNAGADYKVAVRAFYGDGVYGNWDESASTFEVTGVPVEPIPAVSTWGMIVLALMTLAAATLAFRRQLMPATCNARSRPMSNRTTAIGITILLASSAMAASTAYAGEIHDAARLGDVTAIERLIASTPTAVNAMDDADESPLSLAVAGLHTESAKRLIEAGAEVGAKNARGHAALHVAALSGGRSEKNRTARKALTTVLIESGADVKVADKQGKTALHLAILRNRPEMLSVLIAARADVNAVDTRRRTPLHDAATTKHAAAIKLLLAKGAKIDAVDATGHTPLHLAAQKFRPEGTKLLLAAGAAVDAVNAKGQTPLITAATAGPANVEEVDLMLTKVAGLLIEAGAKIDARDAAGSSALAHAVRMKHDKLAALLTAHGATE